MKMNKQLFIIKVSYSSFTDKLGMLSEKTQKLHALGPMGLRAVTTTKATVRGTGQVRI
jgi:gamma-glutamyl phosphate reductase